MEMFPSPQRVTLLRGVLPSRKFEIITQGWQAARQIMAEPIRAKNPERTEAEIEKEARWQ